MEDASPTEGRSRFVQVIVASGHMIDAPERTTPRFPATAEHDVAERVRATLEDWKVDGATLVVTGGARGADIIVAEQAAAMGAEVWLLLALPDEQFLDTSVRLPGSDWERRFRDLRRRWPTWVQPDEGSGDVFARNNAWCLEVARAQAPPEGLRAVVVWNGAAGDGPGGTADFVDRARALGAEVEVIAPLS
jgi:hypothetical protein